jgi:hypothetical protein
MAIIPGTASDPVGGALAWIAAHDVRIEVLALHGRVPIDPPAQPTLYLVEQGGAPPSRCSELEDWVRLPSDRDELFHRADRLLARASAVGALPVSIDDDGVLRIDDVLLILSPCDARLLRALLADRGRVVTREECKVAIWPDGAPEREESLNNRVRSLRARLDGTPLRIHTVRQRGFVIERVPSG